MSEQRTVEEIALECHRRIWPRCPETERGPDVAEIVAALREAVAARDAEWWDAVVGVENVDATPAAAKLWQLQMQEQHAAEAVAEERKTREIVERETGWDWRAGILAALDARESAEPGQPHSFEPCREGDDGDDSEHNFTCALLCIHCGLPSDKHKPEPPALPLGHEYVSDGGIRCRICTAFESAHKPAREGKEGA